MDGESSHPDAMIGGPRNGFLGIQVEREFYLRELGWSKDDKPCKMQLRDSCNYEDNISQNMYLRNLKAFLSKSSHLSVTLSN